MALNKISFKKKYKVSYELVAYYGLGLFLFVFFYKPLLFPLNRLGIVDWDFFLTWQLIVNDFMRHGSLLHWNHYLCGGIPGIGNPQSGALSPFNVLGFFLGLVPQFKVELILHSIVSLMGFHYLCRLEKISLSLGLVGFSIWSFNSLMVTRVFHGQTTFFPLFYVPLMFSLVLSQFKNKSNGLLNPNLFIGTFLMALSIYEDGFMVVLYTYPFLLLFSAILSFQEKRKGPFLFTFLCLGMAVGLSLPRLLPAFEFLSLYPRELYIKERLTGTFALESFFNFNQMAVYKNTFENALKDQQVGLMGYFGITSMFLSVMFFFRGKSKLRQPLGIAMFGAFILLWGHISEFSPWAILHHLPILNSIRAPFKFASFFILGVAVSSVLFIGDFYFSFRKSLKGWFPILFLFLVYGELLFSVRPILTILPNLKSEIAGIDHSQNFEQISSIFTLESVASNKGVLTCRDYTKINREPFYLKEVQFLEGSGDASLIQEINKMFIEYKSNGPSVILLSRSYNKNWTSNSPLVKKIGKNRGNNQMVIHLMEGQGLIRLEYNNRTFFWGIFLSTLFLIGILVGVSLIRIKHSLKRNLIETR